MQMAAIAARSVEEIGPAGGDRSWTSEIGPAGKFRYPPGDACSIKHEVLCLDSTLL
jgi:hypothetical protein